MSLDLCFESSLYIMSSVSSSDAWAKLGLSQSSPAAAAAKDGARPALTSSSRAPKGRTSERAREEVEEEEGSLSQEEGRYVRISDK